jgi:hypothetical protein
MKASLAANDLSPEPPSSDDRAADVLDVERIDED